MDELKDFIVTTLIVEYMKCAKLASLTDERINPRIEVPINKEAGLLKMIMDYLKEK